MNMVKTPRMILLALHVILLVFALAVVLILVGGEPWKVLSLVSSDPKLKQALLLSMLVVVGNLFGIILAALPMIVKTFSGSLFLCAYELVYFIVSLLYLSIDFIIVIGIIFCISLYIVYIRYEQARQTKT